MILPWYHTQNHANCQDIKNFWCQSYFSYDFASDMARKLVLVGGATGQELAASSGIATANGLGTGVQLNSNPALWLVAVDAAQIVSRLAAAVQVSSATWNFKFKLYRFPFSRDFSPYSRDFFSIFNLDYSPLFCSILSSEITFRSGTSNVMHVPCDLTKGY
jgi:hypothetical protein